MSPGSDVAARPAPGLRERKKDATRHALHEAAVRLAVERGPDAVTVEAVADAANVSRRTFSNYFPSKDDALLHSDRLRLARLLELVGERPPDEGAWTALSRAAAALVEADGADPGWVGQLRLVRSHPSLLPARVALYGAAERELAGLLAARAPAGDDEVRARLLAAVFLATLRTATQAWLDHPSTSLARTVRDALATVGARLV